MLVVLSSAYIYFSSLTLIRNGTSKSTIEIIRTLNDASLDSKTGIYPTPRDHIDRIWCLLSNAKPHKEVVVAPPSIFLLLAREHLRKGIEVAAQNVFDKSNGAFTGEISAEQLKDSGVSWTLAGHSERRVIFREDNSVSFLLPERAAYAMDLTRFDEMVMLRLEKYFAVKLTMLASFSSSRKKRRRPWTPP